MKDKELLMNHLGLEEWNGEKKVSMLNTVSAFQTNPIKLRYDKYGHQIDPCIEVKETTLKDLLEDKEFIKSIRNK